MYRTKKFYLKLGILIFFILMFIFPSASLNGAVQGLSLWFNTVLPTLLPFMIISNLIVKLELTRPICKFLYPICKKIFSVSFNGSYPILIGLLSGYPLGAKTSADMTASGKISKKEGQFLLSFCNNASIMFITSYLAVTTLKLSHLRYIILGILYLSTILSAFLCRSLFHLEEDYSDTSFKVKKQVKTETKKYSFAELIDHSILDGFEIITKVGGYIILFSILAEITTACHKLLLHNFNFIPKLTYIMLPVLTGFLEITTGCHEIAAADLSNTFKFIFAVTITAFGGLSSFAQTYSVLGDSGLSAGLYLKTKIMNALLAFIISAIFAFFFL